MQLLLTTELEEEMAYAVRKHLEGIAANDCWRSHWLAGRPGSLLGTRKPSLMVIQALNLSVLEMAPSAVNIIGSSMTISRLARNHLKKTAHRGLA